MSTGNLGVGGEAPSTAQKSPLFGENAVRPKAISGLEGPERHLDAARQKLPRDNFCRSIGVQLPSPPGAILKDEKISSIVGRGNLGGILRDTLGEGNRESKLPRDSGESIFAARHQDV